MLNIVIINGLGFGREVASWIKLMPGYGKDFIIKGFLDDRQITDGEFPILGTASTYLPENNDSLVCALSDPKLKKEYITRFQNLKASFFNCFHQTSFFDSSTKIGTGVIVGPYNTISTNSELMDFVCIYGHSKIGHDCKIGQFTFMESHVSVDGNSLVKEELYIHSFTKIQKNSIYG
jgi:UDP-3-O-[3-hydroxymyristoyl] glucosamine N-acyltransferase